jgi:hypothetical protein
LFPVRVGFSNLLRASPNFATCTWETLDMPTYSQIFNYTGLRELDEAFRALSRATEIYVWPFTIKTHPLFAELRGIPASTSFARKLAYKTEF